MSGFNIERAEILALREGVSFSEAARRCGRKGNSVRRAKAREARRLAEMQARAAQWKRWADL
jgi:hypothetical protein